MKRLNIFIDETGNFGFKPGSSRLYGISFVFHDTKFSIENELNNLNNKLKNLGYSGMLHFAHLIAKHGEYYKFSIETRKKLFWAMMKFVKKAELTIYSAMVDKGFMETNSQLRRELVSDITNRLNDKNKWLNSFDEIIIYYDNGQAEITKIIDEVFTNFNYKIKADFDKKTKRLFQLADMITCIDKVNYKIRCKIKLTKSEKLFFSKEDLSLLLRLLKNKRL